MIAPSEPTERSNGEISSTEMIVEDDTIVEAVNLAPDADQIMERQWEETRLEVSRLLGSIGAAPLAPLGTMNCNLGLISGSSSGEYSHMDVTTELAAAHVDLIQTMDNALKVLRNGTSLRLGLGPTHSGNEKVISRAEKACVERQIKHHRSMIARNESKYNPKLTLSKSRCILHQTMVDQATSLRVTLTNCIPCAEWDEFIEDMRYCSQQNASILTISKLSVSLNRLRDLLSFVMSTMLSMSHITTKKVALLKQSTQLAKERAQFLQSAFELSLCTPDGCSPMSRSKITHDESIRCTLKSINQMQSVLEAAQVSLWAMRQSLLEEQDQSTSSGADDPRIWLSQLKEQLSQMKASVDHFESAFLPAPVEELAPEPNEESPSAISTAIITCQDIELENNEPTETPMVDSILNTTDPHPMEHADKTWVFSASGQQSSTRRRRERDTRTAPPSTALFEQSMLMHDLQKRLGTMQLAKEHDAVKLDANKEDDEDLNQNERQSAPFFMGVQGSVLSELANALKNSND